MNVQLPDGLTGPTAEVSVCGGVAGMASQAICSPAVQVAIAQFSFHDESNLILLRVHSRNRARTALQSNRM